MLDNNRIEVGELFQGRYKILNFLKEWELGEEFLAFDVESKNNITIKKLDWTHSSKETVSSLEELLSSTHKLSHKNILKIHDIHLQEQSSYIVTEAHSGCTLRDKISQNLKDEFSREDIASCLKQVLDALQYAHANGVYHCNLRPEVVVLGEDNNWKISDFYCSTAKSISLAKKLHQLMKLKGRDELYKAPELFNLDKPESVKSDIYSIGLVAIELLGGTFPSFTPSQLIAMKWDWERPFRELPVIPSEKLKEALLDATLNDPEQRLGSLTQFSAALN